MCGGVWLLLGISEAFWGKWVVLECEGLLIGYGGEQREECSRQSTLCVQRPCSLRESIGVKGAEWPVCEAAERVGGQAQGKVLIIEMKIWSFVGCYWV